MRRIQYHLGRYYLPVLLLWVLPLNAAASDTTSIKNKKVESFHVVASTVGDALSKFASDHQVPIGFEVVYRSGLTTSEPSELSEISVDNATVKDVMEAIVAAAPAYRWTESDGTINVLPRQNPSSLLNVQISDFVINERNSDEAIGDLLASHEVKLWLLNTAQTERSFYTLPKDATKGRVRSLALKNVTVRTVLNEIMKTSGSEFWIFFRYGAKGQYFSLVM
jgi:hypothetical protein